MNPALLLIAFGFAAQAHEPVDFLFDVRPILSEHCYTCHGPDDKARKADLRLDRPESFKKKLPSGAVLVSAGHPEESDLLQRLNSDDENEVMPPLAVKNPLSPQKVDIIRRWIAEGAALPEKSHWAFNSLAVVPIPAIGPAESARNPIDHFVIAKLARHGLRPSGEARRDILLRRLSLDLTGLPATPEEIAAFVADDSPDAFDRQVERLLVSPRYGERLANDWLDLARYADTYGYQSDVDRDMSPWRDWVIGAFNSNLPYDQFIEWQIAGDLLPAPSRDQYLATAFNRLHRQTNEGGSIEEEFRTEYVADRVHTFGTAFLGLTLECSRCHDHKYDPIQQPDYYKLSAFFNNIDESGLYSHFTRATPTPTLLMYPDGVEKRHDALVEESRELTRRYESELNLARQRAAAFPGTPEVPIVPPAPSDRFSFESQGTGPQTNGVNAARPARLVEAPETVEGRVGKGLKFSGDNSVQFPGMGVFRRTDPFSFSLWIRPTEQLDRAVILHRSRAWTDSGSRGYELLLDHGRLSFALIHFYPGNAIHVRGRSTLPLEKWSHLAVTYDGSSRAGGIALYLDGERVDAEVIRDNLYRDILHRGEWGDDTGGIELTLAGRFRDAGFRNGSIDELAIFPRELTALEVRRLSRPEGGDAIAATPQEWIAHQIARNDEPLSALRGELDRVRNAENDLVGGVREIMVMRELATRRPTYVLRRGVYDQPGQEVSPAAPEGIFPFSDDLPRNRAGLARWLVDRRNPLTARVVVNRIWRLHFGRGIVATQEDFGNQGQLPTHPELLDWLSGWLMNNDWDLKGLQRLIVTSATYRRSSQGDADSLSADPENRWMARGPKHRLSAEQIRDSALAVSGLLSGRLGGPSGKPYQPAGLWEESGTGKTYVQDKGEGLYRRSLYTFWRRTAPPPTMLTFDATSREVCTAKRETTATPLQSLVLLNDPQYLEAARVLAERLLKDATLNPAQKVSRAFLAVVGRPTTTREQAILEQLYAEQFADFQVRGGESAKYLAVGDSPRDTTLSADDHAALAVVVATCFNHDEFVIKR